MQTGSRFRNVDLHVHSPESECFTKGEIVTPDMIIQAAVEAGMEAIAITDHNTGKAVDSIKQAAIGKGLTVFPGVEITVQPGIHIIAIFNENAGTTEITALLHDLKIPDDRFGNSEALVTKFGAQEVLSIIRNDHHALPILAHIDTNSGVWTELRGTGQTIIQLWNEGDFAGVEITSESLPTEIGKSPFTRVPAYYWSSDSPNPENPLKHSHRGIGYRYSRFKLSDPITWEGLRICLHDPESRIRPAAITVKPYPVLQSVKVEGGFLNHFDINLLPNLNCIIGGRGTGKSCLIEVIRYLFDIPAKTDANSKQANAILEGVFPAGSRGEVIFNLGDEVSYRVERIAGQASRIYRLGENDPLNLSPSDILPLQVYGQKEIYEISKEPSFQLRLIDNYIVNELEPLQDQEEQLLQNLRENAADISHLMNEITNAEEKLARLGSIQEELRRMEQQDFVNRLEQKRKFDEEKRWLGDAQSQIDGVSRALENSKQASLGSLSNFLLRELPNGSNPDNLARQKELLLAVSLLLEKQLNSLKDSVQANWADGKPLRDNWYQAYDTSEKSYQELLLEFQSSQNSISPDRYIQLKGQEYDLSVLSNETEQQIIRLSQIKDDRHNLLTSLRAIRRSKYEIRRQKAEKLSEKLKKVKVTIYPQGYREKYKEYLTGLFQGFNVRTSARDLAADAKSETPERTAQKPVPFGSEIKYLISEIPSYLDPIDLAQAIRSYQDNPDNLALQDQFHIDSDAMRRNFASIPTAKLFELETYCVPDLPMIELQVGSGALGYRHLSGLSIGQKCTALLSLVLLESPMPLLIDQPEDDLDNHFIFEQIVGTLRQAKEQRQFLIATHNANIPVSGDAELIVVLDADEKNGWIKENGLGSIDTPAIKDSVEFILEGGMDAFRIRKEKYGI